MHINNLPTVKCQTMSRRLDEYRTYQISKDLIAKLSRQAFVSRAINERAIGNFKDIEKEAEIGFKANKHQLAVPRYYGIQLVSIETPEGAAISQMPALIMEYAPGTVASELKDWREIKREQKVYRREIFRAGYYFHPVDSSQPKNRIWNSETGKTTLIDLEGWTTNR